MSICVVILRVAFTSSCFYLSNTQICLFSGNIIRAGGGSNLQEGLLFAMKHLHPSTGNRDGVSTVVIVFADGSWDDTAAVEKASDLKNKGATVISIGVEPYISEALTKNISSDPHSVNAFYIKSWMNLTDIFPKVQRAVCSNSNSGMRCQ